MSCHIRIMVDQTVLCSFIIIRRHNQSSVRSRQLCLMGQPGCSSRIVGSGSGNYRHSFIGTVHTISNRCNVLFMIQRRSFTCSTAYNDGICLVFNLKINQLPKTVIINIIVLVKRCGDCNTCASKNCHIHPSFLLFYHTAGHLEKPPAGYTCFLHLSAYGRLLSSVSPL